MRYITRQLYLSMQELTEAEANEASRRWIEVCNAYQSELAAIKSQLPPGMCSFADVTLQDGIVISAVQSPSDVVELCIDASNNPWGPRGRFRIEFVGVQDVEGLANIVGDDWLYEEVHLHGQRRFEYCVLPWRSEFRIVAKEVVFEKLP